MIALASKVTWYAARGSGAVSMILLTISLVLGIPTLLSWGTPRTPRLVVQLLHRNVSLLIVVFLAVHVASSVVDDFVHISLVDAFVPFVGSYRPFWLGLGAVAMDLLLALIVTSLLRRHIGVRTWRLVHWAAYACWPIGMVHGLEIGTDARFGWMLGLDALCTGAVLGAVAWRLAVLARGTAALPLSRATPVSLPRLLGQLRADSDAAVDLRTHRVTMAAPPLASGRGDARLIAAVSDSGLRGRGGGAFPTGRKMATVAGNAGRPIVVVNGAEGEPASSKDRLLLARLPQLVLDGALAAAAAVGADEVVIGLDRHAVRSRDAVLAALDQRHRAGERHVPVAVVELPSRFVAGEESALVHAINGGEAKPTGTRQRVFVRGVDRRPTMVSNTETYAHIAQIVQHGSTWFREHGTPDEPGTVLVTMSGDVRRPGVCEVAGGSALADVLAIAGGTADTLQGLLVGGYYGAWISGSDVARARLVNADLRPLGAAVGCGALIALPSSSCALVETARVLRWMVSETAGQCGPCVHGLPALAGAMTDLASGAGSGRTVADLHRWSTMIEGRGGCTFPDGAVRLVRSTLRVFAADVQHHADHGICHRVNGPSVLRIPAPEPELTWR